LGTVFEVDVRGRRTQRVSVSEGRVVIHLGAGRSLNLGPGDQWQPPSEPAAAASDAAPVPAPHPQTTAATEGHAAATPSASARSPHARLGAALELAPPHSSSAAAASEQAEDEAYLQIVGLLEAGKPVAARGRARDYLLHFPNGFRRVEVLSIATSTPAANGD
jgi:hypothetical protein